MACIRPMLFFPVRCLLRPNRVSVKRASCFSHKRDINCMVPQCSELVDNANGSSIENVGKNVNILDPRHRLENIMDDMVVTPSKNRIQKTNEESEFECPKFYSFREVEEFLLSKKDFSSSDVILIILRLRFLNNLLRSEKNFLKEKQRLKDSKGFLKLWEAVDNHLPHIMVQDLLILFNVFFLYDLPTSSIVFHKLAKLILDNFNQFTLLDVLNIYKWIQKKENNLYLDTLKLSCINYMTYCSSVNKKGYDSLYSLVYFASKKYVPLHIRTKLLDEIFEFDLFKLKSFKTLVSIGLALLEPDMINSHSKYDNYVQIYNDVLVSTFHSKASEMDVAYVLKIYSAFLSLNKISYDPHFLDRIAETTIKCNYHLTSSLSVMRGLLIIPHMNFSLLKKIVHDVFILGKGEKDFGAADVYNLIIILGTLDCTSLNDINWTYYEAKLQNLLNKHRLDNYFELRPLFLAANAAVLGIHDNKIMDNALKESNLKAEELVDTATKDTNIEGTSGLVQKDKALIHWVSLLLHQYVSVMHPSYEGTMQLENLLKLHFQHTQATMEKSAWSEQLHHLFGGENFILHNCKTSLFHVIAFAAILNDDNEIVDVSQHESLRGSDNYLELDKIQLQPGQRFLLFIDFPPNSKFTFKNVDRMVGFGVLYLKILKAMGFNVILLKSQDEDLLDVEKVPYLINQIHKVCGPVKFPEKHVAS